MLTELRGICIIGTTDNSREMSISFLGICDTYNHRTRLSLYLNLASDWICVQTSVFPHLLTWSRLCLWKRYEYEGGYVKVEG